jgi:hypothetical protein
MRFGRGAAPVVPGPDGVTQGTTEPVIEGVCDACRTRQAVNVEVIQGETMRLCLDYVGCVGRSRLAAAA